MASGEKLVGYDSDSVGDRIAHILIQDSTLESHNLTLGKEGASGRIDIVPRQFDAIDKEGSALSKDGADVRLCRWQDWDILCFDVRQERDEGILENGGRRGMDG